MMTMKMVQGGKLNVSGKAHNVHIVYRESLLLVVECIHFSKDQYFLSYETWYLQIYYINFDTYDHHKLNTTMTAVIIIH
jgi:hypothetical protein